MSRSSQFRAGSGKLELEKASLDPPCSWGWWRRRSSWWCAPWSCSWKWTCWSRPGRRCWDRSQQVIQGTSCRMNSFDTQHSHRDQKNRFLLIKIYSGKNSKIEATHLHSLPRLLLRLESLYQDRHPNHHKPVRCCKLSNLHISTEGALRRPMNDLQWIPKI